MSNRKPMMILSTTDPMKVAGFVCAYCLKLHPLNVYSPQWARQAAYESADHCCYRLCIECDSQIVAASSSVEAAQFCLCEVCCAKQKAKFERSMFAPSAEVSP